MAVKVDLKNFGPIESGEITLRPLTIFLGPNNSGKSYAAMVVNALHRAAATRPTYTKRPRKGQQVVLLRERKRKVVGLDRFLNSAKLNVSKTMPDELYRRVVAAALEEFRERLQSEIERLFSAKLKDLACYGKKEIEIAIKSDHLRLRFVQRKNRLEIVDHWTSYKNIVVRTEESLGFGFSHEADSLQFTIGVGPKTAGARSQHRFSEILQHFIEDALLSDLAVPCYYLPAARSGILQGHKALAASLFKAAPYGGLEAIEIPRLSGVVSDFIASLLLLPEEKGPFNRLGQALEKEMIAGEVEITDSDPPEIQYNVKGLKIPLHRASSTVSELAPFLAYVKFLLRANSLLIIEEPEAHLHPQNQRILARFIVRLIRQNVRVLLTTHSEFLLEQFNNLLLSERLSEKQRNQELESPDDFLRQNDVATYSFGAGRLGTKVRTIAIGKEGISEEEFVAIHEELYAENVRLQRDADA